MIILTYVHGFNTAVTELFFQCICSITLYK